MMLRIKAIFFLFVFLGATFGSATEIHFCKGEITDIGFFHDADCVCQLAAAPSFDEEDSCEKSCHGKASTAKPKLVAKHTFQSEYLGCCTTASAHELVNSIVTFHSSAQQQFEKQSVIVFTPVSHFLLESKFFNHADFDEEPPTTYIPLLDRQIHFQCFII